MTQILEKITRKTESARAELDSRQRELDATARKAAELQAEAERLQHEVDNEADRLVAADVQFTAFEQRIVELKNTLGQVWGAGPQGQRGLIPAVDYSGLLAVQAAVDDYKRVRPILESNLKAAQQRLATFEREHRDFFN